MRRWILNTAAALSLVLFLGTVGLWAESYKYSRGTLYEWSGGAVQHLSDRGEVVAIRVHLPVILSPKGWSSVRRRVGNVSFSKSRLLDRYLWGFGYAWAGPVPLPQPLRGSFYALVVPHWFLALLFALLPAVRLIKRWRNRIPPGNCQKCGYDLRASEDRCPECGAPIPSADEGHTGGK